MKSRYKYKIFYWIFALIYLVLAGGWVYKALASTRIHYWFFAAAFAILAFREIKWYFEEKVSEKERSQNDGTSSQA